MSAAHEVCQLKHRAFQLMEDVHFRLTVDDRVPALVFRLDGSDAVLPLASVLRLFEIEAGSDDAQTLTTLGSALRFVSIIRPGDAFPTEILTGKASWKPTIRHRQSAGALLQMKLLTWLGTDVAGRALTPEMILGDDPDMKRIVQEGFHQAAEKLGLSGGSVAVAALLDDLSDEVAYFEALRERLLDVVQLLLQRLVRLERGPTRLPATRRETLTQVTRLMGIGLNQIQALFTVVDEQIADVMSALVNLEGHCSVLRPNRDWLYCMSIAWQEELRPWAGLPGGIPADGSWHLLDNLYRFVAARFLTTADWRRLAAQNTRQHKSVVTW